MLALVFAIALPLLAHAHPMDFGSLRVNVLEGRLKVTLRLHELAAKNFGEPLFERTIGGSAPVLGGDTCHWRAPSYARDGEYVEISSVAVCLGAHMQPFALDYPLPFLRKAAPAFQLMARVDGYGGEPYSLVADSRKAGLTMGAGDLRSFTSFVHLGMAHIGALVEEWRDRDGRWHLPEGLDHIFFVLALIVGGGTLLGLAKNITGFTMGHSLTLALTVFKVVHVHSRWVEAFIALSIAYVAGTALLRPASKHRWLVAALFGTVHGLAFASTLQELELSKSEVLPALFGFNLGVEAGQLLILALVLPLFWLVRRASEQGYVWAHRSTAAGLFAVGAYWFLLRAVN